MSKVSQLSKRTDIGKNSNTVELPPIIQQQMRVKIEGISSLIMHKWSEKALKMIRDKKAGQKTKNREACDPVSECNQATYYTEDGNPGIPVAAIKKCITGAAHKDLGIEKTLIRKSVFIRCEDAGGIIPIEFDRHVRREDYVRVGTNSADLRYRPEFFDWSTTLVIDFDGIAITPEALISLINRAGFGIGICEWRPEKDGEHGRFRVSGEVEIIG